MLLQKLCVPGITTRQLDQVCRQELKAIGAASAPKKYYNAPSYAFYSINDCIVHGLPNDTPIREGDLVKIDVTLIGKSIELTTNHDRFFVVKELSGHGVGKAIHEEPTVLNFYDKHYRTKRDGWSITALPGSLTAHYEHTVLITNSGPIVLTA